jgi:RNA polymerase sigma-70 factor (ECF subfamily)
MPRQVTDQAMVARLLMQHRTALYGYIFACVRNHDDTEDILQNVSMAISESIKQLQSAEGFFPWAREIARRRILEHVRLRHREQALDPELIQQLAEASDRLEERQPASDQHNALLTCLERLPPRSRKLISQRYDGSVSSISEMARKFNKTVQAVYALIKRIKLLLRECVERRLSLENGGKS